MEAPVALSDEKKGATPLHTGWLRLCWPRPLTGRFTPSPNHSFFPNQSYLLIGSLPYLRSGIFPTHPQPSIIPACPGRWNWHRVPKRRLIYFGCRGNSQKNTYYNYITNLPPIFSWTRTHTVKLPPKVNVKIISDHMENLSNH